MKLFESEIRKVFENLGIYHNIQLIIYNLLYIEIDCQNTTLIEDLVQYGYKIMEMDYVIYKDLSYYQRSADFHCTIVSNRPDYNSDKECNNYSDVHCVNHEHIVPKLHKNISYVLKYNSDNANIYLTDKYYQECDYFLNNDDDYVYNHDIKFLKEIINIGSDRIILTNVDRIELLNSSGYNYDRRGSDCCEIMLDFHEEYNFKPTNLTEFFKALYRMKSHKWDDNYELYGFSEASVYDEKLCICINFNHGS